MIVLDNPSYSIKVLLAILNSKLATFYHFNNAPKATKGSFPKILIEDLKLFPLPRYPEIQQKEIITLVDKILAAKKQDSSADTTEWEKQIDQKVYELYGLTEDEIKIVEKR